MATLASYVEALRRPIAFVTGQSLPPSSAVKNLADHIVRTCERAQEDADVPRVVHAALAQISRLGLQVKQVTQAEFKSVLQAIDELLDQLSHQGDAVGATNPDPTFEVLHASLDIQSGHRAGVMSLGGFQAEHHQEADLDRLKEAYKKRQERVQYLKGVGPKLGERFIAQGLCTIEDVLLYFPYRYEDRRHISKIADLQDGTFGVVQGEIHFAGVAFYKTTRKRVFEAVLADATGELKLKWFHFRHLGLEQRLKKGQELIVSGTVRVFRGHPEIHHPELEIQSGEKDPQSFGRLVPIYREFAGVSSKKIRKIISDALPTYAPCFLSSLPLELRAKRNMLSHVEVLEKTHLAEHAWGEAEMAELERVIGFEELFYYCLALLRRKQERHLRPGQAVQSSGALAQQLRQALSFKLTQGQETVIAEIEKDMSRPHPMHRLLQGDVGSGKTLVAFISALHAIEAGFQVALMAPTEILAEQHLATLQAYTSHLPMRMDVLLGRQTKSEKERVCRDLASGEISLVIGTHALIEQAVGFKKLGLVIVDEQHRFGVRQRGLLQEKGVEPHVLVMSATPIPRTLAMTLYGDLDVSILRELPKGRVGLESRMIEDRHRQQAYALIEAALKRQEQAFIVYPLVEASELMDLKDATSMAEHLQKDIFPNWRVGLIHGQMKPAEKEAAMLAFKRRDYDILVATTVIEVGIDVPNATVIAIEHPERLGLSQLHQLRGRVGRGQKAGQCILLASAQTSAVARSRLKAFCSLRDGFSLAEEDLRIRGPGNFFGAEQSGLPRFSKVIFPRDLDLLEQARQEADALLTQDPELSLPAHASVAWMLKSWMDTRLKYLQS